MGVSCWIRRGMGLARDQLAFSPAGAAGWWVAAQLEGNSSLLLPVKQQVEHGRLGWDSTWYGKHLNSSLLEMLR